MKPESTGPENIGPDNVGPDENKPALRFKGFEGEWEERKLGEIAERFNQLRIPVASNLRVPGRTPYYGANGIQDYVEGYTHDGEFVLLAEDGANDPLNYPVTYVNGKIWVNNHAHVLQGKDNILDNRFLASAISQLRLGALLVGGSRPKLNSRTLVKLELKFPTIEEQKMIGSFCVDLDRLISQQEQRLDKLEVFKKAMLDKMFPQKGSKVPEIRFKGFTGEWEDCKVTKTSHT